MPKPRSKKIGNQIYRVLNPGKGWGEVVTVRFREDLPDRPWIIDSWATEAEWKRSDDGYAAHAYSKAEALAIAETDIEE